MREVGWGRGMTRHHFFPPPPMPCQASSKQHTLHFCWGPSPKSPASFNLFENSVKHQEVLALHLPDQAEQREAVGLKGGRKGWGG